jgi:hypothetical protein
MSAAPRTALPVRARVVARAQLGEEQRRQMLGLMHVCYEGVTAERFASDLAQKQHVILLETAEGELVGFSTVRLATETLAGRATELVFSGDTVVHPTYWGSKALQGGFSRFLLARKLRRPGRRVLWLLLSGGYKTYLLMVNNLPRSFPRPGAPPPAGWPDFVAGVARRWFGDQYDQGRGIVRFVEPHYRVRTGIAAIDRETARIPGVAFFQQRNPGHADGDELVCLAECRLRDLGFVLLRVLGARLRRVLRRRRAALPAGRQA